MRGEVSSGNRLLDTLPELMLGLLLVEAVEVEITAGDVVLERGAPVGAVLFPTSGLFTTTIAAGSAAGPDEGSAGGSDAVVDVVGRDGVLSLADALGDATSSQRVRCLLTGGVIAVPVSELRRTLGARGPWGEWVGGLLQAGQAQLAQKVVCADQHPATARCATWLLRAADATGRPDLPLTQQQLAGVLRLRRVTVTTSVTRLRRAGAVMQSYGCITITDRERLQGEACRCYRRAQG